MSQKVYFILLTFLSVFAFEIQSFAQEGITYITLYHGTTLTNAINVTRGIQNIGNAYNQAGPGLYLSTDPNIAWAYADRMANYAQLDGLTGADAQPFVLQIVITDPTQVQDFFLYKSQGSDLANGIIGDDLLVNPADVASLENIPVLHITGTEGNYAGAAGETEWYVIHASGNNIATFPSPPDPAVVGVPISQSDSAGLAAQAAGDELEANTYLTTQGQAAELASMEEANGMIGALGGAVDSLQTLNAGVGPTLVLSTMVSNLYDLGVAEQQIIDNNVTAACNANPTCSANLASGPGNGWANALAWEINAMSTQDFSGGALPQGWQNTFTGAFDQLLRGNFQSAADNFLDATNLTVAAIQNSPTANFLADLANGNIAAASVDLSIITNNISNATQNLESAWNGSLTYGGGVQNVVNQNYTLGSTGSPFQITELGTNGILFQQDAGGNWLDTFTNGAQTLQDINGNFIGTASLEAGYNNVYLITLANGGTTFYVPGTGLTNNPLGLSVYQTITVNGGNAQTFSTTSASISATLIPPAPPPPLPDIVANPQNYLGPASLCPNLPAEVCMNLGNLPTVTPSSSCPVSDTSSCALVSQTQTQAVKVNGQWFAVNGSGYMIPVTTAGGNTFTGTYSTSTGVTNTVTEVGTSIVTQTTYVDNTGAAITINVIQYSNGLSIQAQNLTETVDSNGNPVFTGQYLDSLGRSMALTVSSSMTTMGTSYVDPVNGLTSVQYIYDENGDQTFQVINGTPRAMWVVHDANGNPMAVPFDGWGAGGNPFDASNSSFSLGQQTNQPVSVNLDCMMDEAEAALQDKPADTSSSDDNQIASNDGTGDTGGDNGGAGIGGDPTDSGGDGGDAMSTADAGSTADTGGGGSGGGGGAVTGGSSIDCGDGHCIGSN